MRRQLIWAIVLVLAGVGTASAQDMTKGAIRGTVDDSSGALVPGAAVTVTGPTGERSTVTNAAGIFEVLNLIPGTYAVKASLTGFKTASVPDVVVYVGKASTLKLTLQAGDRTEVIEVTAGAAAIDLSSTAIGSNLNDQLYQNLPIRRGVDSLFYLAPGTTDSLGGGRQNPSISGGSALDNQYVADGVNITDSAFGGLGVFSRSYGTLGVGINTSYIKEVQVKTGGFEPQYGQSQGGIVNIITKSGSNELRGSVYGFVQPQSFESERKQPDDFNINKGGKTLHEENFDVGFDLGGPLVKDKLFFYGSFNPTFRRPIVRYARGSALESLGDITEKYRTLNYAFKLDFNAAPNHQFNFSIFGDPSKTTEPGPFRTLNIDNRTAESQLDFGTRNTALRYSGTLSSTWAVNASVSQGTNHFNELGFANFNQITDRTQAARGNFRAIGLGFFEPTDGKTYRGTFDTTKAVELAGNHTFGVGYQYQRAEYAGTRDRSGPKYQVLGNYATGAAIAGLPAGAAGSQLNAAFSLRLAPATCTLCPFKTIPGIGDRRVLLRQDRGEFGDPSFDTHSDYHAAYAQDTWRFDEHVTALLGVRWEQEKLVGAPGPATGERLEYVFKNQWSPRLGLTIDPTGRGKTKIYGNFGWFHEYIPLDLAERSLSAEKDYTGGQFAPAFTVDAAGNRRVVLNEFGTVTPVIDVAHLLNRAPGGSTSGGITVSAQDPTNPILPGTKLGYAQEWLLGFEQQLGGNFVFSIRYIDRRLKRIVEDAAVVSPEAADFFGQTYFIGNISKTLDAAVNPISHRFPVGAAVPSACDPDLVTEVADYLGNSLGMVCYEAKGKNGKPAGDPGADGVPDGFPDPVHNYKAVEVELNKRFSKNWQLLANYRWAKLDGNFEGHFRNDNGQTDPAISSLFDFTAGEFNLLGDQFKVGPLNTDRRHIVNVYASYAFGSGIKGLNLGGGLHVESGVPINQFLAHPVYLNAGEVPLGGRGALGRTDTFTRADLHVDYPIQLTNKAKLSFIADVFNVANSQKVRLPSQNIESTAGQLNPDFDRNNPNSHPVSFYLPRSFRVAARVDF